MSTVISVRVKRKVKETLERAGINIGEEVRRFLEDLAWRITIEEKLKEWNEIIERSKPSPEGFSARSVREDRESH